MSLEFFRFSHWNHIFIFIQRGRGLFKFKFQGWTIVNWIQVHFFCLSQSYPPKGSYRSQNLFFYLNEIHYISVLTVVCCCCFVTVTWAAPQNDGKSIFWARTYTATKPGKYRTKVAQTPHKYCAKAAQTLHKNHTKTTLKPHKDRTQRQTGLFRRKIQLAIATSNCLSYWTNKLMINWLWQRSHKSAIANF